MASSSYHSASWQMLLFSCSEMQIARCTHTVCCVRRCGIGPSSTSSKTSSSVRNRLYTNTRITAIITTYNIVAMTKRRRSHYLTSPWSCFGGISGDARRPNGSLRMTPPHPSSSSRSNVLLHPDMSRISAAFEICSLS